MSTKNSLIQIPYLPSGKPCPFVLTGDEVIELLRLDSKSPERTLKYFRDNDLLKGFRLGRRVRYRLEDVIKFLQQQAAEKS